MPDPDKTSADQLRLKIMRGQASLEEVETYLGPDLVRQGVAAMRDEGELKRDFHRWYQAVLQPIGLEPRPAYQMFIGKMTMEDYVGTLSAEQTQRFVAMFPGLQSAYQARLDEIEARREGR